MDLVAALALLAVILTVSALAAGLIDRAPLSFPMIFLGLGLLLGGGSLSVIEIGLRAPALEAVGTITLALILFIDAVNLETRQSRRDWLIPALALGPGTVAVILIIAGSSYLLLDISVIQAFLLGALLASTDAVVLRDVVRDHRVPTAVRRALSVEAGTNDIVVLPIVLVLIAILTEQAGGFRQWALFSVQLVVLGPVVGFTVGAVGSWVMSRVDARLGIRREYQALYGIGLVFGAYAAGVGVGGDGFIAAFFAGLAIPLLDQTLCDCFLDFGDAAAEMAMLVAFVLFGALLSEELGVVPLIPGLALAAIALVVARPLPIWLLLRARAIALSPGARAFVAWFGPRGLNSLLFALLVVAAGTPGSDFLFAAAGLVVLVSVVVHGASATPLTALYARLVDRETLAEERVSTATGLFEESPAGVPRMSPEELMESLRGEDRPIVVDARTRSQYERDRVQIPGSVRVPPDQIAEWAGSQLQDRSYVFY